MWRRFFEIPPPFRRVTERDGDMEPPSKGSSSYQTQRVPTKSIHPPTFEAAPWLPGSPKLEVANGVLRYSAVLPRRSQRAVRLGPFSPVFTYDGDPPRTEFVETTVTLASLTFDGETWALAGSVDLKRFFHSPHHAVTVNALPVTSATKLSHGDVIEHEGASWLVRFPREGTLDTGLGPLWRAFRTGALTLDTTGATNVTTRGEERHKAAPSWHAVLRGGTFDLAHDSLQRLRSLLLSDLTGKVESIELHCASSASTVDWPVFIAAHQELARTAPFKLTLFAPHPAVGAKPLTRLENTTAAAEFVDFGSGTRWANEQPNHRLNGAELSAKGWVTLSTNDWVETPAQTIRLRPSSLTENPLAQLASAPWVVLPARRWLQVPLEALYGDWALRIDGTSRWVVTEQGVRQRQADESLGAPLPWFTVNQTAKGTAFFFIPGPSPFFAGAKTLPANAALTPENVKIFIDELLQLGDCAAEGLAAIAAQTSEAKAWHTRLLAPYASEALAMGNIDPRMSDHCAGFLTVLRVQPWLGFARDLPVLLSHPLACRLERLELVLAASMTTAQQESLADAVRECRPRLQVTFVQP